MIRKKWRDASLHNKIFFSFGLLILISVTVITICAVSMAGSELERYALKMNERKLQYVSKEINSLLSNTRAQAILFAGDKTVQEALEKYETKTTLEKYESWSALQKNCMLWVATRQLADIRLHLYEDQQFLRDGIRYISKSKSKEAFENALSYYQLFEKKGYYSCYAPLTVAWKTIGYVEVSAGIEPLLKALDTHSQTGITIFLTDGFQILDADGNVREDLPVELPSTREMTHIHCNEKGERKIYSIVGLEQEPFYIIGEIPAALLSEKALDTLRNILLLLILVLLCTFALAWLISRSLCLRFQKLKAVMEHVQKGELDVWVEDNSEDELGQILHSFNLMAAELKKATEHAFENERIRRESELRLMQAQINPHFINNTLESISWAATSYDVAHVQYLVRNLSHFLRASLSKPRQMYTIAVELGSIEAYWNIQKYRFGEKIHLKISAQPEIMDALILPMLLQPLVENALLHGILNRKDRSGEVRLIVEKAETLLIIEVEDDGIGMTSEQLKVAQEEMENQTAGSYGLWNVNQRIRTQYGDEYGLSLHSEEGRGTSCILTLPFCENERVE